MNTDLSVWSSPPFNLPDQFPEAKLWILYQDQWAFKAKGWHVLVLPTLRSDNKDAPDTAMLQKLPDASHVAYVTLEPIGADPAEYAFVEKIVRRLALATGASALMPKHERLHTMRIRLNKLK